MKKKISLRIAIGVIFIFSFITYLFLNSSYWIGPKDIEIDGHLSQSNSNVLPYRKYIIEFTVTKKKIGKAYLYPFAKGLINPTFEESEAAKMGGIGTGGDGYKSVIDELKKIKALGTNANIDIWGFRCPDEPGTYKFKVYYDKTAGEKIPEEAYITYLNLEGKYCFDNYWTKLGIVKMEK